MKWIWIPPGMRGQFKALYEEHAKTKNAFFGEVRRGLLLKKSPSCMVQRRLILLTPLKSEDGKSPMG
jgi:hypothetical protein